MFRRDPLLKKTSVRLFSSVVQQFLVLSFVAFFVAPAYCACFAQEAPAEACPRPRAGTLVPEPEDLRSQNGVLKVDLTVRNFTEPSGSTRYCYIYEDGSQSPTLRLNPGDLLILNLKNDLSDPQHAAAPANQ